jgi:hypothetical protein
MILEALHAHKESSQSVQIGLTDWFEMVVGV